MNLDINYAVGEEISWERMERMDKLTLVGRFLGKSVSIRTVNKWAQDCWSAEMGKVP